MKLLAALKHSDHYRSLTFSRPLNRHNRSILRLWSFDMSGQRDYFYWNIKRIKLRFAKSCTNHNEKRTTLSATSFHRPALVFLQLHTQSCYKACSRTIQGWGHPRYWLSKVGIEWKNDRRVRLSRKIQEVAAAILECWSLAWWAIPMLAWCLYMFIIFFGSKYIIF